MLLTLLKGLDDMPAHVKSALIGASVTIPIKDGKLVRPSLVPDKKTKPSC